MLSAQGQGEQVLFRFLRLQTNRPQSEHSPGHMVIYNFKICKRNRELRILDDFGGPFRNVQIALVDIFCKAESREALHT